MEMNFCRRCGKPLTNTERHIYTCPDGHTLYANSAPSVGVFFLTADNQVLLSVRGGEPRKGMLDAFGGFVDANESFETAAARELREELSLQPSDYEPLRYITSEYGTYPYQGESLPILSTLFWTRLKVNEDLTPSDDVAEVKKIPLHEIDLAQLHDDDIRTGITKLRELFPITKGGKERQHV